MDFGPLSLSNGQIVRIVNCSNVSDKFTSSFLALMENTQKTKILSYLPYPTTMRPQWLFPNTTIYQPLPGSRNGGQVAEVSSSAETSEKYREEQSLPSSPAITRKVLAGWSIILICCSLILCFATFYPILSFGGGKESRDRTSQIAPAWPIMQSDNLRASLLSHQKWNYTHPPSSPCGNTPASARAAGCKWSAMTFAWYPAACYDTALENEFLSRADWTWHTDDSLSNATQLSRDAVLRGDVHRAFVSADFHAEHCRMSTRKMLRAVLGADGVLADTYVFRMGHLMHCEEFTNKAIKMEVLWAKGVAKYFDCILI